MRLLSDLLARARAGDVPAAEALIRLGLAEEKPRAPGTAAAEDIA